VAGFYFRIALYIPFSTQRKEKKRKEKKRKRGKLDRYHQGCCCFETTGRNKITNVNKMIVPIRMCTTIKLTTLPSKLVKRMPAAVQSNIM
jgi:hypothetical protein